MPGRPATDGAALTPVRSRRYTLPTGKTVHIVASPGEVEHLKTELSNTNHPESFDVHVQSTPEHLETLRLVHAHHQQRHDEIRRQHGHVFEQLDPVTAELEALAVDLSRITHQNISLDANFDRYGYSAFIRVREAPDDGAPPDEPPSQNSSQSSMTQRSKIESIRFWKRPVVRQYFHRGLLWRSSEREEVAAFELFVDLLYVGIIATIGDAAAEAATGEALLQFVVTFLLASKTWSELVLEVQWFETDDILQRISILLAAILLVGLSTNIAEAFESTYAPLIAFFVAGRVLEGLWFLFVGILTPTFRISLGLMALGIAVPTILWIGSIHIPYPERLPIMWIAIVLDAFDKSLTFVLNRSYCAPLKLWRDTDAVPAVNIEHRSERQNSFVTLVFGYMAVNLLYQHSGSSSGIDGFFAKAVLGLITAFCFNSIYFEIDSRNISTHAIRRSSMAYLGWLIFHSPFTMAFVLASGTLSRLVVAYDCPNTNPDDLTERFAANAEAEIRAAHRWFYSAGLGVALLSMAAISMMHVHKHVENQRLNKHYRLALRVAVSVIMICLPAAGDRLNSLELIGIDTALVVLLLAVDYWGSTCENEPFWWDGSRCAYSADCRLTKDDIKALREGRDIDVEEIARKDLGEKEGATAPV